MKYYNLPTNKNWLDKVFRRLRKIGRLKSEIIVLMTGEIIALTYYQGLSNYMNDIQSLKTITNKMIEDESYHIVFQSMQLSRIDNKKSTYLIRKMLLYITANILWIVYKNLFKLGNYRYREYINEIMYHFNISNSIYDLEKRRKPCNSEI